MADPSVPTLFHIAAATGALAWSNALQRAEALVVGVDIPETDGGVRIGSGISWVPSEVCVLAGILNSVATGEVAVYSAGESYPGDVSFWSSEHAAGLIHAPGLNTGGRCHPRASDELVRGEPLIAIGAAHEGFEAVPGHLAALFPDGIPGLAWRKSLLLCAFDSQPFTGDVVLDQLGSFVGFVIGEAFDGKGTTVVPAEHIFQRRSAHDHERRPLG
jgi:hypothetical protein